MNKPSITIDAGHGGRDSGAVGPGGLREKDVALRVARRLGLMLTACGVGVSMTRGDDRFLELHERAQMANEFGTDLFLSIHCNSGPPGQGDGFEVFTTPGQTAADAFATDLFLEYARMFPTKRKRVDDRDGDPDKEASFAVIRLTKMPAALFELEFIHTPAGEAFLGNEINEIAMAEALCDGVLRHLRLSKASAVAAGPSKPSEAGAPKKSLKERLRSLSTQLANLAEEA
jgi:N-acetylmuramoyl-L-alanine amidase